MKTELPKPDLVPLKFSPAENEDEQRERADQFYKELNSRRTVRDYSDKDVPLGIIEKAILTAGTAPSGAHMQPWRFVVVRDQEVKRKIRTAAE
ncbi:MAG: nitroreductase family protein, partial [Acidobacteria bacterium]|nr:nitroreductase family protein [Acidobacteriota bacterium]